VLWGGVHGLLLVIERVARQLFDNSPLVRTAGMQFVFGIATWLAVCLTWVLFRAEDPASASHLLISMLTLDPGGELLGSAEILTVVAVITSLLATHWFMRNRSFESVFRGLSWPVAGLILGAMLAAIVLSPGEERDFIYFEF
jgi:alginate O-acetyltransferase complex protein AlgI